MSTLTDADLAIKFINDPCSVCCCHCGDWLVIKKGTWTATLRDTMEFVCEECLDHIAPNLIPACMMANGEFGR